MTVFEIVETDLNQLAKGGPFLGLWSPQDPLTELSFDVNANSTPSPEGVLWKVNLPGDLEEAQASLRVAENQVGRSQLVISNAKQMLHSTLQTQSQIDPVSYSHVITTPTTLEEELSFSLSEIQLTESYSTFSGAQHWQEASLQFQRQLEGLMKSILNYAWIETKIDQQFLARTRVNLTGDVKAIWQSSISLDRFNLHQRSVTLAVHSRATLVKVMGIAIEGLIQLSKLSNPATAMLALPSIWRYINRAIELSIEGKNNA